MEGVDGIRDGKPPGARGGIQILGMVWEEWHWLAPQAYGGGAGCWVIAGTWPPPGRVSGSQVVVRVVMLAWIFAFVVFRALAFLKAASSTSLLLCVSLRLSLQASSGACSASSWLRFSSGFGRAGGWHPSALSWVPYRLPVSSRLCGSSGVVVVGGLASPDPLLVASLEAGVSL